MAYNYEFMKQAVALACENIERGGGPFGALVVRNGMVVGTGCNSVTNMLDPTAHAEVMAIRDACKNLNSFVLDDCEIYSSCEPCPMCLSAIYWARIAKLYFGATKDDAAQVGFDDSFIYDELSLPMNSRKVLCEQHGRDVSLKAFDLWRSKEDKTTY